MEINTKKKFAAELSIISNIILSSMKIIVGIISGSLSIISEAIHSLSDLFASCITFFSVIKASQPADIDHPYGHGKYEDLSSFIEGLLIILASIYIVYEATKKIAYGSTMSAENNMGIAVMLFAVIVNYFVSKYLFKTAKESGSISLYADGEHLRTDVYSSLGVFTGLVLIKITGQTILDIVIAILTASFIFKAGFSISKKAVMRLLDYSLPKKDLVKIKEIILGYSDIVKLKENSLKARQAGASTDIDFILQFRDDISLCECHKKCEEIEKQILNIYPNSSISIHSEPVCYNKNCQKECLKKSNTTEY